MYKILPPGGLSSENHRSNQKLVKTFTNLNVYAMKVHRRPGTMEKTRRMMPWMFYFGWVKSLVMMKMHYAMIIMQAMVVEMLRIGYGMVFWSCCCSFIWVSVVVGWWLIVYSLYLKSLCLWTSYTVDGSYSGRGYSDQSLSGGYSGDSSEGGSGRGYSVSGGGVDGGERYTDGGSHDGCSKDDGYVGYSYASIGHRRSAGSWCSYERSSYGGSGSLYDRETYGEKAFIIKKYMTHKK